jgi:hypothetical protein
MTNVFYTIRVKETEKYEKLDFGYCFLNRRQVINNEN